MHHSIARIGTLTLIMVALALATPAAAKTVSSSAQEQFTTAEGSTIRVDVSFHDIEVVTGSGDTTVVTVETAISAPAGTAEKLLEAYAPQFSETADGLRIVSKAERRLMGFGSFRSDGEVRLVVPPGVHLDLDTSSGSCTVTGDRTGTMIRCDTSSGNVEVTGTGREIVADTSSGSVTLQLDGTAEKVVADTSSGDVRIRGPIRDLRADTSSGKVTASGLLGSADLDTSSGDVTASWSQLPEPQSRVRTDTSSGSVRLTFPTGVELDGKLSSSSGTIRSDVSGKRSEDGDVLRFEDGPDAVLITVDTSSGDITIREG